jgi:hypothetical protein
MNKGNIASYIEENKEFGNVLPDSVIYDRFFQISSLEL